MSRPVPLPADASPEQVRFATLRAPQPIGTLEEPVSLKTPLEERGFSLTYIKAQQPGRDSGRAEGFWAAADRTSNDPRWRYYELPTGHGTYREMPNEFRDILYEVAGLKPKAAKPA